MIPILKYSNGRKQNKKSHSCQTKLSITSTFKKLISPRMINKRKNQSETNLKSQASSHLTVQAVYPKRGRSGNHRFQGSLAAKTPFQITDSPQICLSEKTCSVSIHKTMENLIAMFKKMMSMIMFAKLCFHSSNQKLNWK